MKQILIMSQMLWVFLSFPLFSQTPKGVDADLWKKALEIHKKAIVLDTHSDVTMKISRGNFDIGVRHQKGHWDLPRAFEGGLDGEFFSIFVPNSQDSLHPAKYALELIDAVYRAVEAYPDQVEMAYTSSDIRRLHQQGKIAVLLGMENGSPIEHSLALLRDFYRLGVRYITLTHSKNNDISDSGTDDKPRWNGLSDFGKEVVREMNRLGMLVDISHLSDDAIRDVLEISQTPVIASHSSVRALSDVSRNLPDELIRKVARNGGVIQINFFSGFLSKKYWDAMKSRQEKLKPQLAQLREKFKNNEEGYWKAYVELMKQEKLPVPDVSIIIDHIDYIVKLVGVDYVGLGSDFDGVSSLPAGMEDVSKLPTITYLLLKRGYSEEDITKILGGNLLRVMEANEKFAREQRSKALTN